MLLAARSSGDGEMNSRGINELGRQKCSQLSGFNMCVREHADLVSVDLGLVRYRLEASIVPYSIRTSAPGFVSHLPRCESASWLDLKIVLHKC